MRDDLDDEIDDASGTPLTGAGWTGLHELVELARREPIAPGGKDGLDRISRRELFRWLGASAAIAGITACSSRPAREIRPYVHQPPELVPGVPRYFATGLVEDGFAIGVIVESHEGRPTKIEGNPDHPASLGATRAIEQAQVLSLYDPGRLQTITERGIPRSWTDIESVLAAARAGGGAGLQLLLEPTSSPMIGGLVARIRRELPRAGITFWSPFEPRASLAGNRLAFGVPLQTVLDLREADVVVSLDADLVGEHPMSLAYTRQLSDRRRVVDESSKMSRIYAVEAAYSTLGTIADHRIRLRASEIGNVAAALLAELEAPGSEAGRPWIAAIAHDLGRARGRSVVVAGERQPPAVHAVVAAINIALGNVGRTVRFIAPPIVEAGGPSHELKDLAGALDRGEVTTLVIVGGDPAFTSPADADLAARMSRAATRVYVGLRANETAARCTHVAPMTHTLEEWGLARAFDGTLTPIQPLIEPLFDGRTVAELLHVLLGDAAVAPRASVAAALAPANRLESVLALGAVPRSEAPAVAVQLSADAIAAARRTVASLGAVPLELALRPHPFVHDGRYANNPWLLELPEPITKLTWDNAAQLSPQTAARLHLQDGDVVTLTSGQRAIDVPVIVVPGHADDSFSLHAGFAANAFQLWASTATFTQPVAVARVGRRATLAITQEHWRMEHRPLALGGTLAELGGAALRDELARHREPQPSIMARFPTEGAQWAMTIDLTTCTGCTACVMACAAENNTPVVGKRQVVKRREMHWLRIDRYVEGTPETATIAVQPMTCQHCEDAPCEYVCPVEATTHSPDGLNEMTYNRCVGTRFCSNNCPYKVRRFNWFDFKQHSGLQLLARNPDVTVRDRGVMEKCTYCVQRIRRAEIDARIAHRPIAAAEVVTACQQACPATAISFGSITDPASAVSEQRTRPHRYAVLNGQGTRPRTMYLARIRNPNPELE
jgi:molybdopterin-containing oxidoreductase family iron-sulfur binding subunit